MADGFYFAVPAVDIFLPEYQDDSLSPDEARAALVLRDQQLEDFLNSLANISAYGLSNTAGMASTSSIDPQAFSIAGLGNVSVGFSAGALVISGAAAGAGNQSLGVVGLGNTAGTTGQATGGNLSIILVGGNNVTLSQSRTGASATITIDGPTTVAQTNQSLGIYGSSQTTGAASSTTVDARSVTLVGAGGVSVGASAGSILISGASGGGGGSQSAGISNLGNTSGTSGIASGSAVRLLLAGGNNVTLSQSVNGASATITISGPNTAAQSAQSLGLYASSNTVLTSSGTADARSLSVRAVGGISAGVSASELVLSVAAPVAQTNQSLGVYASSQTTGAASSTTVDARSLTLVGQGGVSVGASAGSILISGATGGGAGFSAGVSNLGSTAGSTGMTGTRLVLAGTDGMGLSQATDANGATVSIIPPTISSLAVNTANMLASSTLQLSRTNPHFVRVDVPTRLALATLDMAISVSLQTSAAANTAAAALSFTYGIYSESGETITPIVGGTSQTTYSWASNTANFANLTGRRWFTFPLATTLSPGIYYFGFQYSSAGSSIGTATTARAFLPYGVVGTTVSASAFADLGSAVNATVGWFGFQGQMVGTSLSATNQTVQRSQVSKTGINGVYANNVLLLRAGTR